MITKTLNLDEAYQELFKDVREKSTAAHAEDPTKPIIDVNNLEAFYGNIIPIAKLDSKFLRLPLDEPLFQIDANTRKITVPAEFRANGASVQGDHLAEVIFFSIERYFDYKDLSTCNIEINWKMGSKEGKTTRFIKFEKAMTIDDVQSNCIIFGWPINDIVTEKSGQLVFAVEFNNTEGEGDNKKVTYRFNTLPTTINIKDGLILGEDVEAISLDDDIMRALINSSFGEGTAAVGNVVWLTGEGDGLVVGTIDSSTNRITLLPFSEIVQMPTEIINGNPDSPAIQLFAQAFVDSSTEIQYNDINNDPLNPVMVLANEVIDGLKYYVEIEDSNPLAYRLATTEETEAFGTEDEVPLYIKLASITVDRAGSQAIKAQGYKMSPIMGENNTIIREDVIGRGEVSSTTIVTIPEAEVPSEINITLPELTSFDSHYSFDEAATENVLFLTSNGTGSITATANVDTFGALQFTWKKKLVDEEEFSNITEGTVEFQTENSSDLNISAPGEYKVSVVNFQNKTFSEPVESTVITACPLAGAITSAKPSYKHGLNSPEEVDGVVSYNSAGKVSVQTVTLCVTDIVINGESDAEDAISYEWYKQTGAGEEIVRELISTNPELTITNGEGKFVPVIKNHYKGSIYTYTLNPISVNDEAND